jgi:hypothetical protein
MLIFAEDEARCFDAQGHSLRYEPRVASMLDVRLAFKSSPVATLKQRRPALFGTAAREFPFVCWILDLNRVARGNVPIETEEPAHRTRQGALEVRDVQPKQPFPR